MSNKTNLIQGLIFSALTIFLTCCSKEKLPDSYVGSDLCIEVVSGNNQSGNVNEFLKDSIVFRITDREKIVVTGKTVDFKVLSGGGVTDTYSQVSDINGLVWVRWVPGNGLDQVLQAAVKDDKELVSEAWAIANSDITFSGKWISGITFYRNFTEPMMHDNKILETDNFMIFSNSSPDENKVVFAKIAEEHLKDIISWFDLDFTDMGIDRSKPETKIRIYAHTSTNQPGAWSGVKNYGILFPSYNSYYWLRSGLKHEITHIVQLLIIGPENCIGAFPPPWFSEGIAEYFGDFVSSCPSRIDDLAKLNKWITGHKNPISISDYSDMGSERWCEYYTMFGLVVEYLLSPGGYNANCEQVKEMYHDLAISKDFEEAFETSFNVTVYEMEQNIYTWLTGYLAVQ